MKASVFIATSLDGFIARQDGSVDWLPASPEPHGYEEFIATVDAIVIGRKTYDWVLSYIAKAGGGWPYGKLPVVVLSSSLKEFSVPKAAKCELMAGTPHEIVDRLTERGYQHLYIDGGVTIQGFLRAGLIQSITITRIPILLGSGIPLFGHISQDVRWKHVTTRSFASGMVQSGYVVVA